MYKMLLYLTFIAFLLTGCSGEGTVGDTCTVVLEECTDVLPVSGSADLIRGEDISFILTPKNGCVVTGTDYPEYELSKQNGKIVLTLQNVRYSTVVKLSTAYECRTYYPNGGEGEPIQVAESDTVTNTSTQPFIREGYVQIGWNTRADGTGELIGFGSRTDCDELYAQWMKETEEEAFTYLLTEDSAIVTGYHGEGDICVLPDTLGGKKVRVLQKNAFAETEFTKFVGNASLQRIEAGAFENARLETIVLFDNLLQISDESFAGCEIRTLYLNARRAPVYAGSYFSAFPVKCRRLFSLPGKKLVLFSGSSGRYGYDSAAIEQAFADYSVVNMGTYAYTNAKPQLDIILQGMAEGDILVEAPEFDAAGDQFCETSELDRFFYSLVETDYNLITLLDLRQYSRVFDSLNEYLYEHSRMEEKEYSDLASEYDDDGNRIAYATYNEYGDYTLIRPNSARDEMHRIIPADYTTDNITEERVQALDEELARFREKGIRVLFTYAPRNRSSLTEDSTQSRILETEELLKQTLSVPIISSIEDYFYSGIYFYEIDNHLSDEGVNLRTRQVIADLTEWMKLEGDK